MTPSRTRPSASWLSLDEAAARLGVHYMTAYRYVRLGQLPAEQRDGRWWVRPSDVDRMAATPPAPAGRAPNARRWRAPTRQLFERLLAGDGPASWAIVAQALARGATPTDVYLRLLAPALREIGDLWSDGSLSVGDEHRASAVALRLVGRLSPQFSRRGPATAGTILLGGAPGDPHQLPLAMVADVLRHHRLRVVDLGANVPRSSFLDAARSLPDLRAVGISLSDSEADEVATGVLEDLRRADPDIFLIAGGPALVDREAALRLGADDWAPDALGAARLLEGAHD